MPEIVPAIGKNIIMRGGHLNIIMRDGHLNIIMRDGRLNIIIRDTGIGMVTVIAGFEGVVPIRYIGVPEPNGRMVIKEVVTGKIAN